VGDANEIGQSETAVAQPGKSHTPHLKPAGSRIPKGSRLYGRLLPALIVGLGALMVVLIVVAAGVLLGFVPFR
jgi:hypothetical protein